MTNKKIENNYTVTILSFFLIVLIGLMDYTTGVEISFSVFYLTPILWHAMHKGTTMASIILNNLFASIVWFLVAANPVDYSHAFIPYWNAFVRFGIFLIVGLLTQNLKEKQQQLIQLNKELQNLNTEKDKFIGIAAHDLRNPISTIFSFAELFQSDYSHKMDAQANKIIQYIQELSQNSIQLLAQLLDISKIESGVLVISPKMQDYIEFVKKHQTFNQILADKKEIKITFESTHKELIFPFDEHYLSEVINNLLTNAIKFSWQKSEITIKVFATSNNSIRTEITDSGKGIALDEQAKLFKYFHKTSTKPTGGEPSTGLGLAIAKKIITEHKGQIGVTSELNKGSTFYFELFRDSD